MTASHSPYLEAARSLGPLIESEAERSELDACLTPKLVGALVDAGLFKMLVPRDFGGGELDPPTYLRVVEEIAKHDASTAWSLNQSAATGMVAAYLDPQVSCQVAGAPDAILAHSHGPGCRAAGVEGGYLVTGRWTYGTSCHYATWLSGDAQVYNADGSPKLRENGSRDTITVYFPAHQAEIVANWNVSGLRGTGSDAFVATDLFVPRERTLPLPRERHWHPGALYRFSMRFAYACGFVSVGLGNARGLLDAYRDLAANKTPRVAARVLRENAVVQSDAALAEARLRSVRAFLVETVNAAWEHVCKGDGLTDEQRVLLRLATTHGIQEAAEVANIVHRAAGGNAIIQDQPFDRRFRDMHAVTQHVHGNRMHYEAVGQYLLGLPPDMTWM